MQNRRGAQRARQGVKIARGGRKALLGLGAGHPVNDIYLHYKVHYVT